MDERRHAIYKIVRDNQPTGVRFTYYRATAQGLVPKTDAGYRMVQRAVLELRRDGVIPWAWIVDTTRWAHKPTTYGSIDELLDDAARSYRRALWRDAATVVEVWCESDSVAGVLYPVTAKWDVPLYPIKGQTSDSFAYSASQHYRDDARDLIIYYVGDHDPHGYEIETKLRAKLVHFAERDDMDWLRLACTAEDVETLSLIGTPPKRRSYFDELTRQRVKWHGQAVEAEAIDPPVLRSRLDDWITGFIDPEALRLNKIAEDSERQVLMSMKATRR